MDMDFNLEQFITNENEKVQKIKRGKAMGITDPNISPEADITDVFQINDYLYDSFRNLIEDAIDYIEWTLHWPEIVQVVRSVEQGTVRTDIFWERPRQ
jgi:hypothetical protein